MNKDIKKARMELREFMNDYQKVMDKCEQDLSRIYAKLNTINFEFKGKIKEYQEIVGYELSPEEGQK